MVWSDKCYRFGLTNSWLGLNGGFKRGLMRELEALLQIVGFNWRVD